MSPLNFHRIGQALAAVGCVILMVACGGAGELGSGGTGSGSSAALGTVTGLGSVFVDGVRFEDSDAAVQTEDVNGDPVLAETKLGQRVAVAFTVDNVAQTVNIEPELLGKVSAAPGGGSFTVLGQAVVVNGTAVLGPVTQYGGGYTSVDDVQAADFVEVHGVWRTSAGVTVLQATRVEKLAADFAFLRVVGNVSGLSNGGTRFNLGGLTVDTTAAVLVPAGRVLTEGRSVVVHARPSDLQVTGTTSTLTARRVRMRELTNGPVPSYVGGVVSNFVAGSSFKLGDIAVHYDASTDVRLNGATLGDDAYVLVRGNFDIDGGMNARRIDVRNGILDTELRGTAMAYNAAAQTFTVRDVPVVLAVGVSLPANCPTDLTGTYVEVKGRLSLVGVVAQSVECSPDPAGAVIERRGAASNTVFASKTFTLTVGANAFTVRWTPLTFFRDDLNRTSLNGKNLRVEGVFVGSVLVATKIRLDN